MLGRQVYTMAVDKRCIFQFRMKTDVISSVHGGIRGCVHCHLIHLCPPSLHYLRLPNIKIFINRHLIYPFPPSSLSTVYHRLSSTVVHHHSQPPLSANIVSSPSINHFIFVQRHSIHHHLNHYCPLTSHISPSTIIAIHRHIIMLSTVIMSIFFTNHRTRYFIFKRNLGIMLFRWVSFRSN